MITIIATLQVKPGKMEEVIEVLKELAANVKASEPGTVEYIAHTVNGKGFENTIIFYEKYENKEALTVHTKNLPKTSAKLAPLLAPGRDIKICREIK